MTTIEQNIEICGLVTQLTKSQSDNFIIIKNHWIVFNAELKKYNLNQKTGYWVKYGITYKIDDKYFYMTAIPKNDQIFPKHFTSFEIAKSNYEVFIHQGAMENIKHTIHHIYKSIIPNLDLKIEDHKKIGFVYFEKYDYRFQWNKPNSIIEIYLPLKPSLNSAEL